MIHNEEFFNILNFMHIMLLYKIFNSNLSDQAEFDNFILLI